MDGALIILVIIVSADFESLAFQEVHRPNGLSEAVARTDGLGFRRTSSIKFLAHGAGIQSPFSYGDDVSRVGFIVFVDSESHVDPRLNYC